MYLQALIKAEAGELQVQLHAESVREIDRINYMQQGNAALYSDDMLKRRHGIRSHPAVIDAVRRWWRCARLLLLVPPLWSHARRFLSPWLWLANGSSQVPPEAGRDSRRPHAA